MNGNIALSMEIGSAYALQVLLLQIPAVVLYSAIHAQWVDSSSIANHSFSKSSYVRQNEIGLMLSQLSFSLNGIW